jgi:hypothetical protein
VYEVEIWIDIEVMQDDVPHGLCTLFATHALPMRPQVGESLAYWQGDVPRPAFLLQTGSGLASSRAIELTVAAVSHRCARDADRLRHATAVRCEAIRAPTRADGDAIGAFMTAEMAFELFPYATCGLQG